MIFSTFQDYYAQESQERMLNMISNIFKAVLRLMRDKLLYGRNEINKFKSIIVFRKFIHGL